ncbi:MAG: UDP-2,4-diacetamido-2,4,6-trideoxy-beta-L-altropyranose hydrolase, partial [Clostridium sp.]|nr:UDP-2,4-diacetamido-2,4,6-trideoxy-beta-L-altropyranose hydrolase [Clostridium sp.]
NELETGKIVSILNNTDNLEGIIVDTYYVTEKYLEILHKICKTIYIDDLYALNKYSVDILINYNIYGTDLDYVSRCLQTTQILLGPKYVPLRKEFQNIKPIFRENVKNIFISTGGADKFNIAGKLLEAVVERSCLEEYKLFNDVSYHVISGKLNANLPKLLKISNKHKNIIIHKNVSNMAEIMTKCDIAVSACGSTMYELCACGLPIITYSFADNQLDGIRKFDKLGLVINCGDVREGIKNIVELILDNLVMLCRENLQRLKYSRYSNSVIVDKSIWNSVDMIINN